ncbi:MAG: pyridoxamine 5'-phosphate oxidase family protein [Acidimicrobiia bacterium]
MARRDTSMTPDEVIEFLAAPRKLQVATLSPGGWPHIVTMWYVLDGGRVVFRSFTKSQKIRNLQRDPRLAVLAEDGTAYNELRGVAIRGQAELSTDPNRVLDIYVALAQRHPLGTTDRIAVRRAFASFAEKNTVVTVIPERTVSWDHRKLGTGY